MPHEQAGAPRRIGRDLALLFAVALAVRLAFRLATGFDGLYGQDPYSYHDYAIVLRAALGAGHAPPAHFWPVGYPLLVAAASLLVGTGALAGQLVSLLAGASFAPLVAALVHEVAPGSRRGALLAGAVAACAPQHVIVSLSVNSDAVALAWSTLSACALARHLRTMRTAPFAVAAATLGLAVLTRWASALLALPWALAALAGWRERRLAPRRAVALGALAVALGGAILLAQAAPGLARGELSHVGDLGTVGWNAANAVARTAHNSDGTFRYALPTGLYYLTPLAHPAFVPGLLAPFLALGAAALARGPRPRAVLVGGWWLTVTAFLAGIAWQNPRFSLTSFAPLLVLVALGMDEAERRAASVRMRRAVVALALAGVALSLAWSVRNVGRFVAAKRADLAVVRWAEAAVPADAVLITFSITETARHYTRLAVVELYAETPASLGPLACGPRPAYLLLDRTGVESQWRGKSPATNLAWLEANAGLQPSGTLGRYALWRLGAGCR